MSASRIDNFLGDVYRNTIYVEKLKLAFSQFFVRSPSGGVLCIAAGMRSDFPLLKANLETVGIEVGSVSSLIAPHFEADEIAALPEFVAHNPGLVAYGHPICAHALSDIFSIKTKILKDGEPITVSGEVVIPIHAKHVHQWDSLVIYVPRLKALFSSDIFMSYGPVDGEQGALDKIILSIEKAGYLPSLDFLSAALKKIEKYDIEWIFPMHGPALNKDIPATIKGLIDYCETKRHKEAVV